MSSGSKPRGVTPNTDERTVEMRGREWVPAAFARDMERALAARPAVPPLERRVIEAALARCGEWEAQFPGGIDQSRPPTAAACELIEATQALKASRSPQKGDA